METGSIWTQARSQARGTTCCISSRPVIPIKYSNSIAFGSCIRLRKASLSLIKLHIFKAVFNQKLRRKSYCKAILFNTGGHPYSPGSFERPAFDRHSSAYMTLLGDSFRGDDWPYPPPLKNGNFRLSEEVDRLMESEPVQSPWFLLALQPRWASCPLLGIVFLPDIRLPYGQPCCPRMSEFHSHIFGRCERLHTDGCENQNQKT